MTVDSTEKEHIEQLAAEAVREFLEDWQDTDEAQVVEREGEHFLIVKPSTPLNVGATFHIGLRKTADSLASYFHGNGNASYSIALELIQTASVAPQFLSLALHLMDTIVTFRCAERMLGVSSQEIQGELAARAQQICELILRKWGLEDKVKPGPRTVISEVAIMQACASLLRQGKKPSRNQLAKELNTTPTTVRNWLRKKGFNSTDELVADVTEQFVEYATFREIRNLLDREASREKPQ